MYDLTHITKKAYEFYQKINRKGSVWVDLETGVIHVEGDDITMSDLYDEVKKHIRVETLPNMPFEDEKE